MRIILLLGFGGVLVALVALLLTNTRVEAALACDPASGVCSLTQEQSAGSWHSQVPITAIDRAEVRVRRGRGGSPQVWLVTSSGDYFFADYVLRSSADEAAQQINAFLRNPAKHQLLLTKDERAGYWLAWALIPVVVVLLGLLARVLFRKSPATSRN